ncbi:histidine phosphatase family protein [Azospirillum sp. sgz302134]
MKIGLVRHFEVVLGLPSREWMTPEQISQWLNAYDGAEIRPGDVDLGGIPWTRCISSDSPRAFKTAQAIFQGPIEPTPMLREPALNPIARTNIRMPFPFWKMMLRIAWLTSHRSQLDAKTAFLNNVKTFANDVVPTITENTLVVGHAGFMIFLRKELVRQGFRGPKFRLPENGKLYVFEKPDRHGR